MKWVDSYLVTEFHLLLYTVPIPGTGMLAVPRTAGFFVIYLILKSYTKYTRKKEKTEKITQYPATF